MTAIYFAIYAWFAFFILLQFWMTWRLVRAFSKRETIPAEYPPALAVISLRGTDPFLPECLRRLSQLDYPRYTLRIVIDSESDPARAMVAEFLAREAPRNVEVLELGPRLQHCSGKVCGMLRATEQIPDDVKIVAVFDGDALVHPSVLRELAGPILAGEAGVTSGNRWYAPPETDISGLVRFVWNAYAVPMMNVVQIPWGGCMAVAADELRGGELRQRLTYAFGEDSTVATYMRQTGKGVRFVSAATILNREAVGFKSLFNFLVRQMLTVRLHNPRWPIVVGHTFLLSASLHTTFCVSLVPSPFQLTSIICTASLGAVLILELTIGELLVRRVLHQRGEEAAVWNVRRIGCCMVSMILTNLMNLASTAWSFFVWNHLWRGISYRFGGTPKVTITSAPPLQ